MTRIRPGIAVCGLALVISACGESRSFNSPTPEPLTVTAVNPAAGFGSTPLRITGTGFLPGTAVTIGGTAAAGQFVSSTEVRASAPLNQSGAADVIVSRPDGQRVALPGAFTYQVVTITAGATLVSAGDPLSVSWTAPAGRNVVDWIGFFKVGESSTNYESRWWQYTNGSTSATVPLTAPGERGDYEFRYLLDDGYTDVARSAPVTVR